MNNESIIETVNNLIKIFGTRDPFLIAEKIGINLQFRVYSQNIKGYCNNANGNINIIINSTCDKAAQKIICAHELGHAILHVDHFDSVFSVPFKKYKIDRFEHEANIFAAALLLKKEDLEIEISKMSNYLIMGIFNSYL
jgi:Zn-dependent peptidase ImmA (M78 family)